MLFSHRVAITLASGLVAGVVLAACGGSGTGASPAGGSQPPADGVADVTVTATEFAFDPDVLSFGAGSTTTVELKNGGTVEHDFTIDELGVKIYAGAGKTVTGTVGPVEAGTYQFYCSIPGHKEAGMVGELTVP